jgi:putative ATP-binding cassette transporter
VHPENIGGSMILGEMVQAAAAFVVVQAAFSWFTDNYARLAEWTSSANRVAALLLALDQVEQSAPVADHDEATAAALIRGQRGQLPSPPNAP